MLNFLFWVPKMPKKRSLAFWCFFLDHGEHVQNTIVVPSHSTLVQGPRTKVDNVSLSSLWAGDKHSLPPPLEVGGRG